MKECRCVCVCVWGGHNTLPLITTTTTGVYHLMQRDITIPPSNYTEISVRYTAVLALEGNRSGEKQGF